MATAAELAIILTGQDRSGRAFSSAGRGVDRFKKQVAAMALGFLSAQAALRTFTTTLSGTIGAAIAFESSFAGIRKTMDLTEDEFKKLEDANRSLARSIPVTINEINRLGEIAGQLGVRGIDNVVKFEETIAALAVTTDLAADDAAFAFARIANITRTPIAEVGRLGSVVVELGNNFAATESEITQFARRISGTATALGFTVDQIFAIGAATAASGVQAERGGTAIETVLQAIQKAALGAGEEVEAFQTVLGLTAAEFRTLADENPAELFLSFIRNIGAAGSESIIILEALGLTQRRLQSAVLSLGQNYEGLVDSLETASAEMVVNTALTEETGKRYATTASQIQIAKNNFADLGITVGQVTLPAIVAISKAAVVVSDALRAMIANIELTAFAVVALSIPITGPLGIIAAITLLAFKWEEIFNSLPGPVQDAAIAVARFIDTMVNAVVSGLNNIIGAINSFAEKVGSVSEFFGGPGVPTLGDVNVTSDIAGALERALPQPLTRQELARLGERQLSALRAAQEGFNLPELGFDLDDLSTSADDAADSVEEALTVLKALEDGIIDLAEATELGISAAAAAVLELAANEVRQAEAAFRTTVEFEKLRRILGPQGLIGQIDVFAFAITQLGESFREAGESVVQFITRLADAAQDAIRTAFDDIFGQPTREQAQLELQLATLRRQRSLLSAGGRTEDELKDFLGPLDREIDAIENLISQRREENRILQLQLALADQTLLTDQEQLVAARFLITAMEDFTTALGNATATLFSVPAVSGPGAGGGGLNVGINISGVGMTVEQIGAEISRTAQDELRRAGFAGSFIGSGTFVPS